MTATVGPGNLREFLSLLRRERELVEVAAEVDPRLELAEVHRRVIAADGPALLFRRVKGSAHPVVTNLFGTEKRVELALGGRPERWVEELAGQAHRLLPPTLRGLWNARRPLARLLRIGVRRVRSGPVVAVRETPPRLDQIPVTTSWPEDGGPTVTLPLVYTQHPEHGGANLGIYRMQRYDAATTGMHWQIAKGGGFHYHEAERRGEALPVTVFLGGPPAAIFGALAPLPENVPELLVASLLLGRRVRCVQPPGCPHPLLAEAEWCLVGKVLPGERRPEGPFGDHYGYYSLQHDYPVFRCDTVFRRTDPIFPATVVGKPRQEDFYLGDYLQKLLSPLFPLVMPNVRSLWSYGETGFHALAAAVVRERYAREAMTSAFRILGEGQLSLTKFLLVLDQDLDLRDFRRVLEHVLARSRFETDLFVFSQLSMDTLDYTGPRVNEGSKGVLLGLGEPVRDLPDRLPPQLPPELRAARMFCRGCLVVEGPSHAEDPGAAAQVAALAALREWPLVVLSDEAERAAASAINFLWTTFTRFEPGADLHSAAPRVARNHLLHTAPLVIDARKKPSYPAELFCDPATERLVEGRWGEYFPARDQPMGDARGGHLSA